MCGTDWVSVSAAFFSPSHAWSWSLSHQVASIPAMIACMLRGSNMSRSQLLEIGQDEVEQRDPDWLAMSRFSVAIDASRCAR